MMLLNNFYVKTNLLKNNYRGEPVLVIGGIIYSISLLFYWLFLFFISSITGLDSLIFLVVIIASVSLLDDMIGSKEQQGFKGHFNSLLTGRLTTGGLKAIVALAAVLLVLLEDDFFDLLINSGIILLSTNFFNLLDLRPGRSIKYFILVSVLVLIIYPELYIYYFPVYFISIFYLPYEMKASVMLGDTGANVLGTVLAYGLIQTSFRLRLIFVIILLLLNLLSEKYSFTEYITTNHFLKWFDDLGRLNKEP